MNLNVSFWPKSKLHWFEGPPKSDSIPPPPIQTSPNVPCSPVKSKLSFSSQTIHIESQFCFFACVLMFPEMYFICLMLKCIYLFTSYPPTYLILPPILQGQFRSSLIQEVLADFFQLILTFVVWIPNTFIISQNYYSQMIHAGLCFGGCCSELSKRRWLLSSALICQVL